MTLQLYLYRWKLYSYFAVTLQGKLCKGNFTEGSLHAVRLYRGCTARRTRSHPIPQNIILTFVFTSWVETCSGRGEWEHVAGVCVKILRSVVQRVLQPFYITFSPKMGAGGCPGTPKPEPRYPNGASDRIFIDFGPHFGSLGEAWGIPGRPF